MATINQSLFLIKGKAGKLRRITKFTRMAEGFQHTWLSTYVAFNIRLNLYPINPLLSMASHPCLRHAEDPRILNCNTNYFLQSFTCQLNIHHHVLHNLKLQHITQYILHPPMAVLFLISSDTNLLA